MKNFSKVLIGAAALALCVGPTAANAGSQTTTLSISASVTSNCTALTPSSISFGSYDVFTYPTGTPLKDNTAATFSTNCTLNAPINWTVGIGNSCGQGSVPADRAMTDGASHYLSYELYQNSAFTTPWAFASSCGAPTAVSQTGAGSTTANTISVYGLIPGGQNAYENSYSDSVTVTVSF
jgi:spore coat protein U-like protein